MDIPAIVNELPLETRLEVRKAIRTLMASGVFELIAGESAKEVLAAAMVLAHSREYEQMERVSIQAATMTELLNGLQDATKEI